MHKSKSLKIDKIAITFEITNEVYDKLLKLTLESGYLAPSQFVEDIVKFAVSEKAKESYDID